MASTTTIAQQLHKIAILKACRLALGKASGYNNAVITKTSSNPLLPDADQIINLDAMNTTNSSSSLLLPDAVTPSLPTA
jgi:hypothetical protein